MTSRLWTQHDIAELRRLRQRGLAAAQIGETLGRTDRAVWNAALKYAPDTLQRRVKTDRAFDRRLCELHAKQWSDPEIAAELGCERHTVARRRRAMELPSNAHSPRKRRQIARRTKRQLEEAGLPNMAYLRLAAWRKRAAGQGWPDDLNPTEAADPERAVGERVDDAKADRRSRRRALARHAKLT